MPIAGFVRLRRHIFGRQSAINTAEPGQRAYPFKGVPDNNLNWTDPDIDAGSIYPIAAPTREAPDLTAALTAPTLNYNDLPLMFSGIFGGGENGTGTPDVHWGWDPAAAAPLDDFDLFTYQFGDDVTTDWFQLIDGYLTELTITGPSGLGALSAAMTWRFGDIFSTGSTDAPATGTVPAPVTVAVDDVPVYLKDASIFIADTTAGLSGGQVLDALNNFELRIAQVVDEKRAANGTQTFAPFGFGRGEASIELEMTFHKTADIVGTGSESDKWMSDVAVNRYIQLVFESTAEADTAVPYSWTFTLPCRYYTRTEGEINNNTAVVLTAHGFYDPDDLAGIFPTDVVNTLADIGAS